MQSVLVARLSDVLDPETGSSIVALGVVRRVEVVSDKIEIELDGRHPLATHFRDEVEAVVRDAMPAAVTEVRLVPAS